jgi:uncharacterized RDD family membrane protein YckC
VTDPDAIYADWYVWARRNLSNDSAVCHAGAAAALQAELRGGSREEAILAARQSTTSGAHLAAPDPGDLRRRSYAEWFDWARRELGGVREQQHAAARAAIATLDSGQGANAAMAAARQAAGLEAAGPAAETSPAPTPAIAAPPAPYAPSAPYAPYPAQPSAPPSSALPAYAPAWPPPPTPAAFAGYAGFWRRVAAYVIDSLVLTAALLLVTLIGGFAFGVYVGLSGVATPTQDQLTSVLQLPVDGAVLAGSWLYFTLFEASSLQATLGKLALGIRVTDLNGQRIGWGRANGRFFGKFLSGIILGIGYLMVAWTARKQALHDMVAATLVVRKP